MGMATIKVTDPRQALEDLGRIIDIDLLAD
jgi:hypothetical protein